MGYCNCGKDCKYHLGNFWIESDMTGIIQALFASYGGKIVTADYLVIAGGGGGGGNNTGGQTVNINLKIDKASEAEAIALAKRVKDILMKDKSIQATGSK